MAKLSLQGCMAVGKTTAAKFIERNMPGIFVDYENPVPAFSEAKRRGLDQNTLEGFAETQRLFIEAEIRRYRKYKETETVLFDLGAEEIEFYTLYYPKSAGFDWDIETLLRDELSALRECKMDGVLFLDAQNETLTGRKLADAEKKRGFFDYFLSNMADAKRAWFSARVNPGTDFLEVGGLNAGQAAQAVVGWINRFICP